MVAFPLWNFFCKRIHLEQRFPREWVFKLFKKIPPFIYQNLAIFAYVIVYINNHRFSKFKSFQQKKQGRCSRSYLRIRMCPKTILGQVFVLSWFLETFCCILFYCYCICFQYWSQEFCFIVVLSHHCPRLGGGLISH